jgi:hypothetical protein
MIDRAAGGEPVGRRLLDQSRWVFTRWRRLGEGSIARPTLRSYVSALRGVVGHLLREGASCGCAWTAKVCRKILEAEEHLWTFAEVEEVAPDNKQRGGACVAARRDLAEAEPGDGERGGEPVRGASALGGRDMPAERAERVVLPHRVLPGDAERATDPVSAILRCLQAMADRPSRERLRRFYFAPADHNGQFISWSTIH